MLDLITRVDEATDVPAGMERGVSCHLGCSIRRLQDEVAVPVVGDDASNPSDGKCGGVGALERLTTVLNPGRPKVREQKKRAGQVTLQESLQPLLVAASQSPNLHRRQ